MAPNCDSDSVLPVLQRPDPPTQLSLLSQSMMDQQVIDSYVNEEKITNVWLDHLVLQNALTAIIQH